MNWPCQNLHGGRGTAIYDSVDGLCKHEECNPINDNRKERLMSNVDPKHNEIVKKFDIWIANRKWAENLTNQEITKWLIDEMWITGKFHTKQSAIIEEVIDRLTKGDKQDGHDKTESSS